MTALKKIQILNDEKDAHEGFLLMRARQQQEERYQFRKAWRRRRSGEDWVQNRVDDGKKGSANGFGKLRLLQRYGSVVSNLSMTESTVVACRG